MYPSYSFAPHMGNVVYVLAPVMFLFEIEKYNNNTKRDDRFEVKQFMFLSN